MKILTFDVGVKNLSFCYILSDPFTILEWNTISLIDKEQAVNKVSIGDLTTATLLALENCFDEQSEIDIVLIENQPSSLNGLMKSISMVIFTFFKLLSLHGGSVKEVKFISATNKLKVKKNLCPKEKLGYNQLKKKSIELASMYLEQLAPNKLEWFFKLKKTDDYSDTLLYAIYYMETQSK